MSQDKYVPRYKESIQKPQYVKSAAIVAQGILNDTNTTATGLLSFRQDSRMVARAYIELEKHHAQTLERHKSQMQELIQKNMDLANKLLEMNK